MLFFRNYPKIDSLFGAQRPPSGWAGAFSLSGMTCLSVFASLITGLSGCSSESGRGTGALSIRLEPEDVIVEGLAPGDAVDQIRDGWQVSFDKYVVAVGDVELHHSTDGDEAHFETMLAVDLRSLSPRGIELFQAESLAEGRWDFEYGTEEANLKASAYVEDDDFKKMRDGGFTHLIQGSLDRSDGVSCPPPALASPPDGAVVLSTNTWGAACYENPRVEFDIATNASAHFGPCSIDELPGAVVVQGQTKTVAISIHGDHLFFNGFPSGGESQVTRRAQWLADCDLNLDGKVTTAELAQVLPSDVLDPDLFQLGGSTITPIDNMETYVRAQLRTQGHYQGEGECPVDGTAHEH